MRTLLFGILVAAAAIAVAVALFTVDLGSENATATEAETGQVDTGGAASSGPVAFPSSGTRKTKAIWQDPLGATLIVVGVAAGVVIVVRGRRRTERMDTADA